MKMSSTQHELTTRNRTCFLPFELFWLPVYTIILIKALDLRGVFTLVYTDKSDEMQTYPSCLRREGFTTRRQYERTKSSPLCCYCPMMPDWILDDCQFSTTVGSATSGLWWGSLEYSRSVVIGKSDDSWGDATVRYKFDPKGAWGVLSELNLPNQATVSKSL